MLNINEILGGLNAFGYEVLTVGVAASGLTANQIAASDYLTNGKARAALISVDSGNVRFRLDGAAPTGTAGHYFAVNSAMNLVGLGKLSSIKFIRDGSEVADAKVSVTYFR